VSLVPPPPPKLLELRGISKSFPGIKALDRVGLEVGAGEVVALAGENGAGKSTLIKILAGIELADEGDILIDGRRVEITSVRDSMKLGISLIHQELNLAENLDIAENIFLGKQPYRGWPWMRFTNRREMRRRSAYLLDKVGLPICCTTRVRNLSPGQKQLVEVAKAFSADARLMIFDEPTSSLTDNEAQRLMEVISSLKQSGVSIIYVSHRLAEISTLADRVVVLRDGRRVGVLAGKEICHPKIVSLMVGRDVEQFYQRTRHQIWDTEVLRVQELRYAAAREPINFKVNKGEVLGLAGLMGSGRTELVRVLFGIDPALSGRVSVSGREIRLGSPRRAIASGMLLVPEERKTQGLVLQASLVNNVSMAALPKLGRWGLLNTTAERTLAKRQIHSLAIRASSLNQRVFRLSGGNQQKVVLAKWLALNPAMLILDEPTRGIDVGAKSEIYALISELAARGVGIMLISSEMPEIIALSDRVLVMHEGRIQGELVHEAITEMNIMALAVGKDP